MNWLFFVGRGFEKDIALVAVEIQKNKNKTK